MTDEDLMKIYHTFLDGLRDYTQDKRGDIGAWMREASMIGLQTLTVLIVMKKPILLTENLITKFYVVFHSRLSKKLIELELWLEKFFTI